MAMEKKIIKVNVEWAEKNFCASVDKQVPGAVVVTDKTLEGLKQAVREAVEFHVEGMLADGDEVPAWLAEGNYDFEWVLGVSALLRNCGQFVSLAAIARASGINEQQLSHYANGLKRPRPVQRQRIVDGLHRIGQSLISVE